MRDPKRIPYVLADIQRIWEDHPDLRLGQLLYAACYTFPSGPDLFNIEDDELVRKLVGIFEDDKELYASWPHDHDGREE